MKNLKKKDIIVFFIIAALIICVLIIVLFYLLNKENKTQESEANNIIVPWNPGGTADLVTRMLINEAMPEISIRNVHGANGTLGLNEVYNEPHDGKTLLGTNLSAFVTAEYMGFTEHGYDDWEIWLTAYAPSIVAVKADSPHKTLDSLLNAAVSKPDEITCANAGNGTLGFVSAYLFAESAGIEVIHTEYSGFNPAVNAVVSGEADYIVALSSELIEKLRSGEVRALAVLDGQPYSFDGVDYEIPEYTEIPPFGEYYGIMLPKGAAENIINAFDSTWKKARESESFGVFAKEKGLLCLDYSRGETAALADSNASVICWTLYDTGTVNVSPETAGLTRS